MSEVESNKIALFVYNLEHGGAEKVSTLLCNELFSRNFEVELWVINYRETSLSKELNKQVPIVNLNKKHTRNAFFPLLKTIWKRKPESILVFHTELAILVFLVKKIFFIKRKVIVRNINTLSHFFQNSGNVLRNFITSKLTELALKDCHKIVAQSKGMCEDLVKSFNIDSNKIETIFNPALTIGSITKDNHEQKKLENEFLYVGRLNAQKGLTYLLRAFAIALRTNSNLHLTIVGEGEEEPQLKTLVKELGLTLQVSFEGFQTSTISYYLRAKATVLTSLFEGFPNVLVESISLGTPVIAFDCPSGPKDIIVQEVNGILVEHKNIIEFAKALLRVANNDVMFKKSNIIDSASKFSVESTVTKYVKLLTA
ncbi:glycosyltransferase [Draconibacterium orientale]|nr:glycosyltransferase [Draconibacterium orientale]